MTSIRFFLCVAEKNALLCSSLKCSSVANWVLWNDSLSRKSNCDKLKEKTTLNMCTKVFQILLNWAFFLGSFTRMKWALCARWPIWNKKWCSGAHFQIITQKGRRKVKLIQRQKKKKRKFATKFTQRLYLISNEMTAAALLLLRSFAVQLLFLHFMCSITLLSTLNGPP